MKMNLYEIAFALREYIDSQDDGDGFLSDPENREQLQIALKETADLEAAYSLLYPYAIRSAEAHGVDVKL